MSDNQLLEVIERYLNGDMSPGERKEFELLRKENADVDGKVIEHQQFTSLLKQYGERVALENRLNAIHQEIDVHTLKENLMVHPSWIVQLWRHHHSKISVAATVALFIVVSVMFLTGRFNNHDSEYVKLKNNVDKLNLSNEKNKSSINDIKKIIHIDKYSGTGTGFAITSDGLIATNYHVIEGVDSIHVQNADGKSFRAELLYSEPQNDIAILKIVDKSFEGLGTIPYTFKRSESDLAEPVSTYGYPTGQPGWYPGNLSSKTGLKGDSLRYQISIPINPGSSGGPLWDSKGNVIAITDAKEAQAEGEHFAIKAKYLLDAIHNIPADSLDEKVSLNKKNTLSGLNDVQRVKRVKNYVFMVKTYN
ncbi:MAG: serine protease [Mucilaginibacter sp.]|nr:serine protease [Mucilaginibacter sp.]